MRRDEGRGVRSEHACCRHHRHGKSDPVTGRDRCGAANGDSVPARDLSTCNKVWVYSITSSARSRIDCGMVTPSTFAVFRLITSSNFVRLQDRHVGGFGALENLNYLAGDQAIVAREARSIAE